MVASFYRKERRLKQFGPPTGARNSDVSRQANRDVHSNANSDVSRQASRDDHSNVNSNYHSNANRDVSRQDSRDASKSSQELLPKTHEAERSRKEHGRGLPTGWAGCVV